MKDPDRATCVTCYGTGEIVSEEGAAVCPDCLGHGLPPERGGAMEWRLREIERAHRGERDADPDVRWLVLELRRSREALVRILTLCQDATDAEPVARQVKYIANEILGLYETAPE
jgi:hypothetical protein